MRIHRVRRATWGEKLLFYDVVAGGKEVKSNRGRQALLAYDFKRGSWPIGTRFSKQTRLIFSARPYEI